jgi:hypothetical protein
MMELLWTACAVLVILGGLLNAYLWLRHDPQDEE